MTENRSNFCLGIMSYLTDLIKYHQQGSFKFFRIIKTPKQHPLKKQSPRKSSHLVHFYVIHILGCILILVRVINYTCKVENMDDLMTSSVSTLLQLVKCGLGFFSFEEGVINLLYSTFFTDNFRKFERKTFPFPIISEKNTLFSTYLIICFHKCLTKCSCLHVY